jgi:hypothetical protein
MAQTDAYEAFLLTIKRPRALLEMFDAGSLKPKAGDTRSPGKPSWQENELLRAAVITAIGALDAYLSDAAAEILVAQLENANAPGSDARLVLKQVLDEIKTLPLELALVTDAERRRDVAKAAIQDHLVNRVSNHGAKGVAATLTRMGESIDWSKLDSAVTPNLKLANVRDKPAALLDAWTTRRHQLVHHGKALRIGSPAAKALVDFVEAIAAVVDEQAVTAKKR